MSVGLELIRAIIEAGDADAARLLRPEHFTSNEREAADFFLRFYRHHGAIPSERVMRRHGHRLPQADGNVSYQRERLLQRSIFRAINRHTRALAEAVSAQDAETPAAVNRRRVATTSRGATS